MRSGQTETRCPITLMLFISSNRSHRDEERMLPLIDVVFLVLIFFMLAGTISASDPIRVEPPRSAGTGEPVTNDLVIVLAADGRLVLEGQIIESDRLGLRLAEHINEAQAPMVWLKADAAADSLDVLTLLETLRESGVSRLQLLTTPAG